MVSDVTISEPLGTSDHAFVKATLKLHTDRRPAAEKIRKIWKADFPKMTLHAESLTWNAAHLSSVF